LLCVCHQSIRAVRCSSIQGRSKGGDEIIPSFNVMCNLMTKGDKINRLPSFMVAAAVVGCMH